MMTRAFYVSTLMTTASIAAVSSAYAQRIEPRAYINAPVGINFVAAGYINSQGALLFDLAIPVTDADANVDMGLLGYLRTLGIVWQYRWSGGI